MINRHPPRGLVLLLALLPFFLVFLTYVTASAIRLADNPADKLLPALSAIADAIDRMAFTVDARTDDILMLADTLASLERLAISLAISITLAVVAGLAIGLLPYPRALFSTFVDTFSMVPPLAILPILFITVGLGEAAKITLIAIGITPPLIRDVAMRTADIPRQQLVKAQTLGASTWTLTLRVVLPQVLPRLIDSLRLQIGPAWLFLIAAEAIAAEAGLGYRIFLVRRYLAMDVILPYVAWITLLAFMMDYGLRILQRRAFPWFADARASA